MAKYHSKGDVEFYNSQVENHEKELEFWKQRCITLNEQYDEALKSWNDQVESDELTPDGEGPISPELPPEPLPPSEPIVYEAQVVEAMEEIDSPHGPILVTPGRYVMRGSDGSIFAISDTELAYQYQEIHE